MLDALSFAASATASVDSDAVGNRGRGGGIASVSDRAAAAAAAPSVAAAKESVAFLDLHRILHAMEKYEAPQEESWRSILARAEMAQAAWRRLLLLSSSSSSSSSSSGSRRLAALEDRLRRACRRASEIADDRRREVERHRGGKRNLARDIFFAAHQSSSSPSDAIASPPHPAEEENGEVVDDDKKISVDRDGGTREADLFDESTSSSTKGASSPAAPRPRSQSQSQAPNVQDLQRAQREQIEEAISQMASQMKRETERIHETLRTQTEDLGDVEELATDNVDAVAAVADDVKEHVSASWTRAVGTWTLLFTMAGTFLFCLITIWMVPKRPGACLFFCPKTEEQFCRVLPGGRQECIDAARVNSGTVFPSRESVNQSPERAQTGAQDYDGDTDDWVGRRQQRQQQQPPPNVEDTDMPTVGGANRSPPVMQGIEKPFAADQSRHSNVMDIEGEEEKPRPTADLIHGGGDRRRPPPTSPTVATRPAGAAAPAEEREVGMDGAMLESKLDRLEAAMKEFMDIKEAMQTAAATEQPQLQQKQHQGTDADLLSGVAGAGAGAGAGGDSVFADALRRAPPDEAIPLYQGRPFSPRDMRKAAATGHIEQLTGFLEVRPDWVDYKDGNGWTALHLAARAGQTSAVEALLKFGCDVQSRTGNGQTALDVALKYRPPREREGIVLVLQKAEGSSRG